MTTKKDGNQPIMTYEEQASKGKENRSCWHIYIHWQKWKCVSLPLSDRFGRQTCFQKECWGGPVWKKATTKNKSNKKKKLKKKKNIQTERRVGNSELKPCLLKARAATALLITSRPCVSTKPGKHPQKLLPSLQQPEFHPISACPLPLQELL